MWPQSIEAGKKPGRPPGGFQKLQKPPLENIPDPVASEVYGLCYKAVGIGEAGESSASPLFTKVPAV